MPTAAVTLEPLETPVEEGMLITGVKLTTAGKSKQKPKSHSRNSREVNSKKNYNTRRTDSSTRDK
jgi:hypothetical protein